MTRGEESSEKEEDGFVQMLFLSTPADPQKKGELSLSYAMDFADSRDGRDTDFGFAIGYGVTDRLTLEIEVPYLVRNPSAEETNEGFGDLGFNALYNFYRTPTTLLSAYTEFHVPTSGKNGDLSSNHLEWEPALLAAHRMGDWEIDGSIGGAFARGEQASLTYSLAVSHPVGPVIGAIELSGLVGDEHPCTITPGLIWDHDAWEVGLGVPIGLNGDSEHWGLRFEVSYTFP
jgi:Putative MetA-pathway of phenol degradation